MPAVVASRTQCTEQMFEALKTHIKRERQKKKEEQEADAEVERQRKERELQQKQDVMTLEENREQISKLETTLAQLKDEKHQLFRQLKKVLNEDDRRRQLSRQQDQIPLAAAPTVTTATTTSASNEVVDMYGMYPGVPPMGGHMSHLVLPPSYPHPMANREPLYKIPPPPHSLIPPGAMKRPRSPSPPPQIPAFHQNYPQKPAPPQPRVTYLKSSNYNYYHHNSGNLPSSSVPPPAQPGGYGYPSQPYVPPNSRADLSHPDPQGNSKKHPIFMSQGIARPNMNSAYMHSSMDHSKMSYAEDKYYSVAPIRPATHVPIHGGAIPIQQPSQGTKTGGITSGYPIRPPSSAPPHIAPVSNTSIGMYGSQTGSNSRVVYSQSSPAGNRGYMQPRQDQC